MTDIHTATFRGNSYKFQRGMVHPQYSIDCFLADEREFREKYWGPKAGDVVVDAGASYGAYSLTAAACGAKVIAFEPEPTVFVDLMANQKLNDFDMVLFCAGLWDEDHDRVNMYEYAPHWPPGTISRDFDMVTLDSRLFDERLDWYKLDVEGAEERALCGSMKTIAKFSPIIICECHVFLDPLLADKCEAVIREASGNTYSFERVPRDPCVMLIARPEEQCL